MSPITHFLVGWSVAASAPIEKKDRLWVALAGIVPDIDGAGLLFDFLGPRREATLDWWSTYHHVLGHNLGWGLLVAGVAVAVAAKRRLVALLVMLSFHLHLLGDLLGSRGPEGYQWPIPYLLPFSNTWQWIWSGQWQLNAWPNFLITGVAVGHMFYIAWKKGVSPIEIVSCRGNRLFVEALRGRFGAPPGRPA